VRGTVIENVLVASGSADVGSTLTSKSEKPVVSARRSSAMLVSLIRPAVVTLPMRTGPAGCCWEAGGLAGAWPDRVAVPDWLAPFLGAEALSGEPLGEPGELASGSAPAVGVLVDSPA
jgi:hypothetical protein